MKMVTGIGAVQSSHAGNIISGSGSAPIHLKEPAKSDRRSNKPIMEKRRRARINNCLNELKTLILDATKKDPARHSKLEKADILEKTVKYLQDLQRQQAVMSQATDPKVVNKFKAGFTECANEVSRFPSLDPAVKRRLLQHLSSCINGVKSDLHQGTPNPQSIPTVQVHMLPSPPSSPEQDQQISHVAGQSHFQGNLNSYYLPNGLQVIPTKLQNGNITLVMPQGVPQGAQIPMLVPIPSRTSSTSSAASAPCHSYERYSRDTNGTPSSIYAPPSPANSYEAMDCQPSVIQHGSSNRSRMHPYHVPPSYSPGPAPLSLVVKKERDEDQPWRPW